MSETVPDSRAAPSSLGDEGRWHGRAFGFGLDGAFPARGLFDGHSGSDLRRTSLELVSGRVLEDAWSRNDAQPLRDLRDAEGGRLLAIEEHPELGYRLDAPAYGRYVLSRDGSLVLCDPNQIADWEWQAFLIGQVLPLAAVLHGLEAVHASAVGLAGHAVALVADSHGGKSSLAVNLALRGASFVTDDVLALERRGQRIVAHPGAGITSVRHAEASAIGQTALERLGTVVGRDEHELRVAVEREQRELPLGAIYFIVRSDQPGEPVVEEISPPDPRLLLGSTFNGFVRATDRLVNQLDLYAHTARTVPVFRAIISPGVSAQTLAGSVEAHALSAIEGRAGS
ncbi:MAG: hypothetical protein M3350_05630 [Actinomycetota bacterium]|nr:hypothetical protein [Actinomycetota bacterium]